MSYGQNINVADISARLQQQQALQNKMQQENAQNAQQGGSGGMSDLAGALMGALQGNESPIAPEALMANPNMVPMDTGGYGAMTPQTMNPNPNNIDPQLMQALGQSLQNPYKY